MKNTIRARATAATRARYGRIAPVYDLLEILPELRFRSWRRRFWDAVAPVLEDGDHMLEVGIGTGKNMPFWPQQVEITAIDLTPGMVARARKNAEQHGLSAEIREGDVQTLDFADDRFDIVVGTFVFCSVPDPVLGLNEVARVVKPGGQVFLMEHVRSANATLGRLMDWVNPIVRGLMGPNINRNTVGNVEQSGLTLAEVIDLDRGGIFKIIRTKNVKTDRGGNV